MGSPVRFEKDGYVTYVTTRGSRARPTYVMTCLSASASYWRDLLFVGLRVRTMLRATINSSASTQNDVVIQLCPCHVCSVYTGSEVRQYRRDEAGRISRCDTQGEMVRNMRIMQRQRGCMCRLWRMQKDDACAVRPQTQIPRGFRDSALRAYDKPAVIFFRFRGHCTSWNVWHHLSWRSNGSTSLVSSPRFVKTGYCWSA